MKKVSSLVLALVMAVCLAVPAFAAGGSEGDKPAVTSAPAAQEQKTEEVKKPPLETLSNGLEVTANVSTAAPAGQAIVGNLGSVLQNVGISVAPNQTCSIAMLMELDGEPGTYTFDVPTAGPADKVLVLHWVGGSWVKVGEGYGSSVSAYFASFSPVAIVVIKDNGAPAAAAAAGTGALKAPQTGDSMAIPFVAFAVIALAGVVAVKARKEEV